MTAALTIIAVLAISVLVIRVGGVALQQTGLTPDVARFQALSVFTGCGFTTTESESIVNFPVRRKIALTLMVIGNIGLVGMLSTVVVTFVGAEGNATTVFKQFGWLLFGVTIIFICLFNKRIDAAMCRVIGQGLVRFTSLGSMEFTRLLQMKDEWSVASHLITEQSLLAIQKKDWLEDFGLRFLAIESERAAQHEVPKEPQEFVVGDRLILFGPEDAHQRLATASGSVG